MNADQIRKAAENFGKNMLSRKECRRVLLEAAHEVERQSHERWSVQLENERLSEENRRLSQRLLGLRKRVAELDRIAMETGATQ